MKLQDLSVIFTIKYADTVYQHILNNNKKLRYDDIVNAFKDILPEPLIDSILKKLRSSDKVLLLYDKFVIDDRITQKQKEIVELQEKLCAMEEELDILLDDYI